MVDDAQGWPSAHNQRLFTRRVNAGARKILRHPHENT
jgi:hypothetical protein